MLKYSHADELLKENSNMKDNYGFDLFGDPNMIKHLENSAIPRQAIQGSPWYSVLSNPNYCEQFQYTGAYITERETIILDGYPPGEDIRHTCEQSDLVLILLSLAYIPDYVIRSIDFS